MTQMIFSDETPKGWIPPCIAAPFICIFLFVISMLPFDLWFEHLGFTDARGYPRGPFGFSIVLVSFISVGLVIFGWVRWIEKRSLASVGLRGEHGLRKFLTGLILGMAMLGTIVLAIALAGGFRVSELFPAFASPAALGWIALFLLCFTVQASVEEFVFRGWLFSTLMRRTKTIAAVILTSAAFSFLHFSPRVSLLMLSMTFIFSIFACAWVRHSNSIWGVMGWHTGWNWFGGTGFDVPVSGLETGLPALVAEMVPVGPAWLNGAAEGPEGSVFTVALLIAACLIVLRASRSREGNGADSGVPGSDRS